MARLQHLSFTLKRNGLIIGAAWTLVILLGLGWNIFERYRNATASAHIQALFTFEKDLVYRRWSASHGGVYVPITEKTPANPYLSHIVTRDVTTTAGQHLTLVNPAI